MAGLQAPLSNASSRTSRCVTHDSGPVWFAIPLLLRTFTFYSLRSLPAHYRAKKSFNPGKNCSTHSAIREVQSPTAATELDHSGQNLSDPATKWVMNRPTQT